MFNSAAKTRQAKEKIGKLSPPFLPPPPANRRITMPRPVPSNCNRRVPFNKDIVQGHKGRGFNSRRRRLQLLGTGRGIVILLFAGGEGGGR